MNNQITFWHEKLDVYKKSLLFVTDVEEFISELPGRKLSSIDHLERASESIIENIVNGNSQRSKENRNRYFDIALGSLLESSACLDICSIWEIIDKQLCQNWKMELQRICKMLYGLMRSNNSLISEKAAEYNSPPDKLFFKHETLNVYQESLNFVNWVFLTSRTIELPSRYLKKLDILSTSITLNIAEGNGRLGFADHRKFIDISHQSALKAALTLDILQAKKILNPETFNDGKRILKEIVKFLLGMRNYLKENE